jgi:hypothetical protein
MPHRTAVAGLLTAVLCAGCADFQTQALDRANDFVDCFKLEAGYGGAVDVEAQVTDWVSSGLGAAGTFRWGFDGRELVGFRGAPHSGITHHYGFPIVPLRTWLGVNDYEEDGTVSLYYTDLRVRDGEYFSPSYQPERVSKSIVLYDVTSQPEYRVPHDTRDPLHAYDVHLGATLLGSLRIGFSPGEMADFATGWFGHDLAGDDRQPPQDVAQPTEANQEEPEE